MSRGVIVLFILVFFLSACASSPPKQLDNLCKIFEEKKGWYKDAKRASTRWGIPIATNMAFVHQESRFRAKARPPRKMILGFIPGPRKSSSYGYSQAKKDTWKWYQRASGQYGADRNDFDDAIDFVAWYNHISVKKNKIKASDPYALYLAYHEGHGGYARATFKNKKWLRAVAQKVARRSQQYSTQLKSCEKRLNKKRFLFF